MATMFDAAFDYTMDFEGWNAYTDDPDDHGGATKYGITIKTLHAIGYDTDGDGSITNNDVRLLSVDDAKRIIKERYWDVINPEMIKSERIAIKIFDHGVNMGPAKAVKIAQQSLNDLGFKVDTDGKLGPNTAQALNLVDEDAFFVFYINRLVDFYRGLNQPRFIKGWTRRANTLP